jgi:ankyrin repeat protein
LGAGADVNAPATPYKSGQLPRGTVLQKVSYSTGFELSIELARLLLDAGADVNAPDCPAYDVYRGYLGVTTLQAVVESRSVEIVQMLLDAGANINIPRCSPLLSAVQTREPNIALVRVLIAVGTDVNDTRELPLIIAAVEMGNIDLVVLFLAASANVNAIDSSNRTALEVVVKYRHKDLVQVLLDAGVDVNISSPDCEGTALGSRG